MNRESTMNDDESSPPVQERHVLEERARVLARPAGEEAGREAILDVVAFRLGKERYAVPLACVQGVSHLRALAPLPCTPAFVTGITLFRGNIISVLDISNLLGVPSGETGAATRERFVLVLGSAKMVAGLLADAIDGMKSVPVGAIQQYLGDVTSRPTVVRGMTSDGTVVLDGDGLLADPSLIVHKEI